LGHVGRATCGHHRGSRRGFIDVDVDDLLRHEAALWRLQAARTPDEVKAALQDVPSAKVSFDPEITIEFTPER
jgi:hypothetical protein